MNLLNDLHRSNVVKRKRETNIKVFTLYFKTEIKRINKDAKKIIVEYARFLVEIEIEFAGINKIEIHKTKKMTTIGVSQNKYFLKLKFSFRKISIPNPDSILKEKQRTKIERVGALSEMKGILILYKK